MLFKTKRYIKDAEDFIKMKKQEIKGRKKGIKINKWCIEVARQEMFIDKKKIEMAKKGIKICTEDINLREAAIARDNMIQGEVTAEIKRVQHILDSAKKDLKEEKKLDRKVKKN